MQILEAGRGRGKARRAQSEREAGDRAGAGPMQTKGGRLGGGRPVRRETYAVGVARAGEAGPSWGGTTTRQGRGQCKRRDVPRGRRGRARAAPPPTAAPTEGGAGRSCDGLVNCHRLPSV